LAQVEGESAYAPGPASGIDVCPALSVALQAGTYYVQLQGSSNVPSYFFRATFPADAGTETEPNDAQGQANAAAGVETFVLGAHPAMGNDDWYAITVPAGKSIRAELVEGDLLEACEGNDIDSLLTLYNPAGVSLGTDDDDGRGNCSAIDGTGATPRDGFAHNLAAGTYYLKVKETGLASASSAQFNYSLIVTIR
jgi:hypothetical protein